MAITSDQIIAFLRSVEAGTPGLVGTAAGDAANAAETRDIEDLLTRMSNVILNAGQPDELRAVACYLAAILVITNVVPDL